MAESIQFFKKREKIYPRRVWGKYRKLKWIAMAVLLTIYYGAPWLRWDRGAESPDQAILIDLHHTRAYFFGIEIWPQEVYYITGILILAAVGLFFVTSLFGRVWCGYACPQTVWTDLFVWVERIIQGDRNARKKLDDGPWNFEKIRKKFLTHLIWLIIGLCTGGAWVFYFNDAPTLMDQILHADVPNNVAAWIIGLTFSTYLMAGFAREQVCTYMCPYARFQSAMFDKDTLIIAYDQERGEPRGKWKKKNEYLAQAAGKATYQAEASGLLAEAKSAAKTKAGHCIDCDSCVVVCPMGIDIREGLQMECIACGLCVDACDSVMEKIGLPKGLIRYDTESKKPFTPLRPRTYWYTTIITLVGCLMLYNLITRSPLEVNVIHDRNPLFVKLSDGGIRNGYIVHLLNKSHADVTYALTVTGIDQPSIRIQSTSDIAPDQLSVFADSIGDFRVFLTARKQKEHRADIVFCITAAKSKLQECKKTIFVSEGK